MSAIKKAIDHFWYSRSDKDKNFANAIAAEYTELNNKAKKQAEIIKQLAALSWARWVSVEDRLPDERGYYLASGAYLTGDKWIDKLYFDDDQEWYSHQSLRRSTTHWMPLPPAPEQVNKE